MIGALLSQNDFEVVALVLLVVILLCVLPFHR